jgi:hypothetical protein
MKPKVEKITRAGTSMFIFGVFFFCMTAVTASSFHTSLRLFLS